jgi:hypothetical protein
MFFVGGAEGEPQNANVEGKHEASRAAAAMMQGANDDDVAKVGAADHGNFRPDDQAD